MEGEALPNRLPRRLVTPELLREGGNILVKADSPPRFTEALLQEPNQDGGQSLRLLVTGLFCRMSA